MKDKIKKLATKVEEENFDGDLEMVGLKYCASSNVTEFFVILCTSNPNFVVSSKVSCVLRMQRKSTA